MTSSHRSWLCLLWCLLLVIVPMAKCAKTIVTKPGKSEDDCRLQCRKTTELDCRYFNYREQKEVCYLSHEYHAGLKKLDRPDPSPNKSPASSWIAQLQARILTLEQKDMDAKKLHKDIQSLKTELASLKNSRALTHHLLRTHKEEQSQNLAALDDKVETLKTESKRVEDAVMTLGELQKTLGERIKKIADTQTSAGLTIAMLSQANKDMRTSIRQLAESAADSKQSQSELRKKITELEVRFAGLSTDVMDKVANVDAMVGPDIHEVRTSQTNLAQSLSLLTKKMMVLSPKLPHLQRKLAVSLGKVEGIERNVKDLHKEISLITDRVGVSEAQLKKFVDPSSTINTERRRLITKLRAEVAVLQDGQEKVKNDLIAEMSERSKLYKQISGLKVSRRVLVEKVSGLEEAVTDLARDLRRMAQEGPKSVVVNHLLTRQESTLQALKAVRETQLHIKNVLKRHKSAITHNDQGIKTTSDQVQEDEEALYKLQRKLIDLYTKLKVMEHGMVKPKALMALARKQKDTIYSLNQLVDLQDAIQVDMSEYKTRILTAEDKLDQAATALNVTQSELESLRRKTSMLYAAIKWKVIPHNAWHHHETLTKLADLSGRQASVAHVLDDYSHALAHTQHELQVQHSEQTAADIRTAALRQRIKALRRQLELSHLHTTAQHHQSQTQQARMKHVMAVMTQALADYKKALSSTQTALTDQHQQQLSQALTQGQLRRRVALLKRLLDQMAQAQKLQTAQQAATHAAVQAQQRRAMSHSQAQAVLRGRILQLRHTLAAMLHAQKVQQSAVVHTQAEMKSQKEATARALYTAAELKQRLHTLEGLLARVSDTAHQEDAQLRLEGIHRASTQDAKLANTEAEIETLAGTIQGYKSELENTKQELHSQRSNSAHALASSLGLKDKVSSLQGQLQAIRDKEDMSPPQQIVVHQPAPGPPGPIIVHSGGRRGDDGYERRALYDEISKLRPLQKSGSHTMTETRTG